MGVFLHMLYATRCGFVELAYIIGDPSDKDACQFRREFWAFPNDTQRIRTRITELGRRYGNVYLSANLYQQPSRRSAVLPGRVVLVDDAPLDLPCSFSVRTSPSSKHAYFLLDQDAPAEALRDVARRAAYALGGDKSGWDSQQLVRVPGTFNTKAKHGGRFPVVLQPESGQTYTVEQLRALWPAVAAPSAAQADDLHWPEVERWLGNLNILIGTDGLPRRVKPTTQTGRVLSGVVTGDSSLDRYIVARGLVMHGYPDDEAAALLWHYCEYGKSGAKGSAWLSADIARVLAKVRNEQPGIVPSPTRYRALAPAQPLPQVERPKRGRKITLTPTKLHTFYDTEGGASGMVMHTITEVAAHFGVSRATVERCERVLKAQGAIERRLFNRRQSSCVAILRPVTSTEQPVDQPPVHVTPYDRGLLQPNAEIAQLTVHGETHPPDVAPVVLGPVAPVELPAPALTTAGGCVPPLPASPPSSLRAAVAEAVEVVGTRYGFGQQQKPVERVIWYVRSNGGGQWSDGAIEAEYRRVLTQRAYAKADQREIEKARAMRLKDVRRKARALAAQGQAVLRAAETGTPVSPRIAYVLSGEVYITRLARQPSKGYGYKLLHLAGLYAGVEAERDAKINEDEALQQRLQLDWLAELEAKQPHPKAARVAVAGLLRAFLQFTTLTLNFTKFTSD